MNKQEIIDAAESIATGISGDPNTSTVIDSEMTAEDLVPLAFRHAYKQLLTSGEMRAQETIAAHTIALTANVGTLPTRVLTEYLEHSFLPAYPYSSYLRHYSDYIRSRFDALLSYYTVNNGSFYSSAISSPGNGNVVLHAPSLPDLSVSISSDISIPAAARDAVIMTLAMALRGELKLVQ